MGNWIIENIELILGVSSGGGLTAIITYFLWGKKEKEQGLKKGEVDIKTADVDYAVKVSELYESLLAESKKDKEELKVEKEAITTEFKSEKEYFRAQLDEVRKTASIMQEQFNQMQLAYSKEVEISQNWEKLHRQVTEQYNELNLKYNTLDNKYTAMEVDHEKLKKEHDKLKGDFDKYKKDHKLV